MVAIILSAGEGKRLGELTKNTPKPLIEINGHSLIERNIDKLLQAKITQIIVNVHYLSQEVIKRLNGKVLFFHEEILLGHLGTIKALRNWLDGEEFIVLNADTIGNLDIHDLIKHHTSGTILQLSDNEYRGSGAWIYPRDYFDLIDPPVIMYRPRDLIFFDCGTPEKLNIAKEYYEH